MKDILQEIIAYKRIELEEQKMIVSVDLLERRAEEIINSSEHTSISMKKALTLSDTGIIAEFKRRSPSKGWIKEDADLETITTSYQRNGATALSILTDSKFFGGNLKFISSVRKGIDIPILRKDFVIDYYQLLQAKCAGADAVLLIAACLSRNECSRLVTEAHSLGLEILLETHSEDELEYVDENTDMLGVNNRNLGSFVTDVNNSFRMADYINKYMLTNHVLVSESGISNPETIKKLRNAGYKGFLLGEAFMKTDNPGDTLRQLIDKL